MAAYLRGSVGLISTNQCHSPHMRGAPAGSALEVPSKTLFCRKYASEKILSNVFTLTKFCQFYKYINCWYLIT